MDNLKIVIDHLQDCIDYMDRDRTRHWVFVRGNVVRAAFQLLKAQEPQPPKHIHEEYPEHDWERKKDGSIDEFSEENGYHNGPRCKRCGESFCIHCEPDGYEKRKQCVVDKTYCPKCGVKLFPVWGRTKITYCNLCGQGLKWK